MNDLTFPEHEYLTVKELAELLRLKERKVYDLAASGAVPCSRATGKLLFPASEIKAWIEQAQSGGVTTSTAPLRERPHIVLGSHDPLLDWAIRQSCCGLATYYDGSLDGLERFVRGEGIVAGIHIHDAQADDWNVPAASEKAANLNAVLIAFATRQRGLVFRSGEKAPSGMPDLATMKFAPRQPGSGTDVLFRELAEKNGLDVSQLDFADVARTEDEAVEMVRRGEADAAFGLEAVARVYGLEFLPVLEEKFALLFDRRAWFGAPVQKLMAFCRTEQFANRAAASGGYDISELGTVLWNA